MRHGYGVFHWPDIRKYDGFWVNGKQEGVGIYRLTGQDVVRHPVVARILKAYDTEQL